MNKPSSAAAAHLGLTWRSEAFAEDLTDALPCAVAKATDDGQRPEARWSLVLVPLLVALVGMAFAVVPPLA